MKFSIFQHFRDLSMPVRGRSSSLSMLGQGYIPRGRETRTSGGSGGQGRGPVQTPKYGEGTRGQTDTSKGSETSGGGPVQIPKTGEGTGGQTDTSAGSGTNSK